MIDAVVWYLIVMIAGWLAFPMAQRLFRFLPDRGYTLSKPFALLGWGFLFWILTYLGILGNNPGSVLFALILLAVVSFAFGRQSFLTLWSWVKNNKRLVITSEVLFLLAFAAWTFVRAANPEINWTEKPMELAFINSIMRSPAFPPNDPWLSGYAISYYYFGYIIISMLVHLSGTISGVAFNLAVALWFALTAIAAYGIVYNLLAGRDDTQQSPRRKGAAWWALLAPIFILIVSNLSGLMDVLHARGLFWQDGVNGAPAVNFWTWLNLRDINVVPAQPYSWMPQRGGWLWWMGSRVVQDFNTSGASLEVIDEFPFFSYLLADLHPHVLGMPFVLLAVGLALNLAFRGAKEMVGAVEIGKWIKSFDFWPTAIILGGLSFLNTWDFPIYVAIYAAVYTWLRAIQNGWGWKSIADFVKVGLILGITGGLIYLPFYIGFSSQAGGLLPSMAFQTRGVYFLIMFLPLLVPIVVWQVSQMRGTVKRVDLKNGMRAGGIILAALWLTMFLVGGLFQWGLRIGSDWQVSSNLGLQGLGSRLVQGLGEYFGRQGDSGAILFQEAFFRRITDPITWLILVVVITLAWSILSAEQKQKTEIDQSGTVADQSAIPNSAIKLRIDKGFVVILILAAAGLVLLPEFFYLKDGFGTRLNTIFKFYFQAWILFGLAAAYTSAILWQKIRGLGGWFFKVGWGVVLGAALIYPVIMLQAKTGLPGKSLTDLTLDGKAYLQKFNPEEWAAFEWLRTAPAGVVTETVGASYNPDTSRVSTHSGQSTVLGWQGHEWQWRGGADEIGSRAGDLELLYQTDNWDEAAMVAARYNIRYIYIGPVERINYRVSEAKFQSNLAIVFQNSAVTIYEVPGYNPQPLLDAFIKKP